MPDGELERFRPIEVGFASGGMRICFRRNADLLPAECGFDSDLWKSHFCGISKDLSSWKLNVFIQIAGYASHLAVLAGMRCQPAHINPYLLLPRGCLSLPGHGAPLLRRR